MDLQQTINLSKERVAGVFMYLILFVFTMILTGISIMENNIVSAGLMAFFSLLDLGLLLNEAIKWTVRDNG